MKTSPLHLILLGVMVGALLAPASTSMAQRRGAEATPHRGNSLRLKLKWSATFGAVRLRRGTYRLTTSKAGLTLTNPRTMVSAGTIAATVEETTEGSKTAVRVIAAGEKITIIVNTGNRRFTAVGAKAAPPREGQRVVLARQKQVNLDGLLPQEKTVRQSIHEAIDQSYIRAVKRCADLAQKSHWRTDDKRYWNCLCPNTSKWLFAKPKVDMRIHHHIAPATYGFSLTVTPKGKVKDCRVWVGAKPPADEIAEPTPNKVGAKVKDKKR